MFLQSKTKGFTLIELLVVISIIALLSSVVLSALNSARAKARDAHRMGDLKAVQTALELYYNDNGSYPSTGSNWWGVGVNGFSSKSTSGAGGYIPGLAPQYIAVLPVDPKPSNSNGYLYTSDGINYEMITWMSAEGSVPNAFVRPRYPEQSFAIYSPGYGSTCSTGCP